MNENDAAFARIGTGRINTVGQLDAIAGSKALSCGHVRKINGLERVTDALHRRGLSRAAECNGKSNSASRYE